MTPLDASFRDALLDVARRARLLPLDHPRFPAVVAEMTRKYNDPSLANLRTAPDDELAARLGFWFPRDLRKVEGAVRELQLEVPTDRPLRVVDLGAGLGASHRGLLRGLGGAGLVEVLAVDDDPRALSLASELAKKLGGEGERRVELRTEQASFAAFVARIKPVDVVLVGQVLGELDRGEPEEVRQTRHAEMLEVLARKAQTLIVVEPALRLRARHVQHLRAALIARGLHIHAPCLHEGACPQLTKETDWCHEDLPIDLPEWLVPVARAAGLRFEGLTFSHLVVRKEPRAATRPLLRAVSGPLVSKGKRELLVCGAPLVDPSQHGLRLGRLDRAKSRENEAFDDLVRGDVFELEPHAVDEKGRLGATTRVVRGVPRGPT